VRDAAAALAAQASGAVFVTKAEPEQFHALVEAVPSATYHPRSRLVVAKRVEVATKLGTACVVSAGTADLPVADEAAEAADALGLGVARITDVGVAGIHRVLERRAEIEAADVAVVVAGMDGALPSVVAGLISRPVVAVPTSVGYGASFDGLAALLTMLNACAPGVSVVNIDNGFGAALVAHRIVRNRE
jgi:NCAIR mutase (PurE)-related protein